MLVGSRPREGEQAPCVGIVRRDRDRPLQHCDALEVRRRRSRPHRNPALLDQPRGGIGRGSAARPKGNPAGGQRREPAGGYPAARDVRPGALRLGRRGAIRRLVLRQPIADAWNRLDAESGVRRPRHFADLEDRAVERVVADELAVPACGDNFVAREHRAIGVGEREKHLHDAGLHGCAAARPFDRPHGRAHRGGAECEIGAPRERKHSLDLHQFRPAFRGPRKIIRQRSVRHHSLPPVGRAAFPERERRDDGRQPITVNPSG